MAQFILDVPDPVVPRVVDALCGAGHWSPDSGMTRAAFAKAEVARLVRERVVEYERHMLHVQAETAASAVTEPTVE